MLPELIEKRQRLHNENTSLLQKVKADGRDVPNSDEDQEWKSRDMAIDALTEQIERYKKAARIEAMLNEPETRQTSPNPISDGARLPATNAGMSRLRQSTEDFENALRGWFMVPSEAGVTDVQRAAAQRVGLDLQSKILTFNLARRALQTARPDGIRAWQERALTVTTTGGGHTIPDETMQAIEKALLWYGPMRQVATIVRTETGADMPWPTVNDTTNVGAILDINTQWTPQDVAFGQLVFKAFKYTSKPVLVPIELMQDNAVNLPELLGNLLGERIARIQNTHFTTGAGTTLPFGITVEATAGPAPTGTVAGGFTYPNFVDLEHSIDPAYRNQGCAFMMHDTNIAKLKKLTDGATPGVGRPIWMPNDSSGMASGAPSTLLGYPVWANNDMSSATTNGTRAILFGLLSKYMIREVLSISLLRLDERYADFHQVAFSAVARADARLLNAGTNPVKYMAFTDMKKVKILTNVSDLSGVYQTGDEPELVDERADEYIASGIAEVSGDYAPTAAMQGDTGEHATLPRARAR